MDAYTVALIIHLLGAIFLLGFVFTDVVILPVLKKSFNQETLEQIKTSIAQRATKVFPFIGLVIFLSGGMMFSRYINSDIGFVGSPLQLLLMVKFILTLFILVGSFYLFSCTVRKKKPSSFMKWFHVVVLLLGIIIVFCAKLMFVV